RLRKNPSVGSITSFIGTGAPRFYLPLDQQLQNQNFAQLLVMPKREEDRDQLIDAMRAMLAADFPTISFKAETLCNGPPVGWAFQIRVIGPARAQVMKFAHVIEGAAREHPQVFNVHNDWLEPVPTLKLDVDQDRARAIGVTSSAIRQTLQAVLS